MAGDIFVSLLIGVLAGLGVGSGGLLMLYLTALCGLEHRAAAGLNLAVFSFALASAILVHLQRRKISVPILLTVVAFGAAGAVCGSLLARAVDVSVLRFCLGLLLLFGGASALFRK